MRSKLAGIFLGSLILSIGINFFLEPFQLMDGGIIGISLIFFYIWKLKVGLTILLLSIPIFIFAWFYSKDYFINSLQGMLISSLFIDWVHPMQIYFLKHVRLEPLLSSIFGGSLVGVGVGLMLRSEVSTGGTDLLAQLISKRVPVNVGILIFAIDFLVIFAGWVVLPSDRFVLSMITIICVGITTTLCSGSVRHPSSEH